MGIFAREKKTNWPQVVTRRVKEALGAISRPPRTKVPRLGVGTIALLGVAFALIFTILMLFVDAGAIIWARNLPRGVVEAFRTITDLGKAAWFLYPLPALLILFLLLPARLPSAAKATLSAVFARLAFLFFAIGIPYWFNAVLKQVIGRA